METARFRKNVRRAVIFSIIVLLIVFRHEIAQQRQTWTDFAAEYLSLGAGEPAPSQIPKRIWMTWHSHSHVDTVEEGTLHHIRTWTDLNPKYRYELVTDDVSEFYVQDHFAKSWPEVFDTFMRLQDNILRADYLRYLIMYADGGIYSDLDTDCAKPIDDWIPKDLRNRTGYAVGLEYDQPGMVPLSGYTSDLQLCQWTLISTPGHPVARHVVDVVTTALRNLTDPSTGKIVWRDGLDIQEITGPRIYTRAVIEGTAAMVQKKRGKKNNDPITATAFSSVGNVARFVSEDSDVLVLPVSAFNSDREHSGSLPMGNDFQLIRHDFSGSWKVAHGVEWKVWSAEEQELKDTGQITPIEVDGKWVWGNWG